MQFATLYLEMERNAALIRSLVMGFTPDEARLKPSPETWSVLKVVGHLCDEERHDFRVHLGNILHARLPITAPGTAMLPYNERDLTDAIEDFVAERIRSLAWLKELGSPDWETSAVLSFGPANEQYTFKAGDMMTSWVAHDNLHLRQLVELQRVKIVHMAEPYSVEYAGKW